MGPENSMQAGWRPMAQAQGLSRQLLAVKIRVVLVAAGSLYLFVIL